MIFSQVLQANPSGSTAAPYPNTPASNGLQPQVHTRGDRYHDGIEWIMIALLFMLTSGLLVALMRGLGVTCREEGPPSFTFINHRKFGNCNLPLSPFTVATPKKKQYNTSTCPSWAPKKPPMSPSSSWTCILSSTSTLQRSAYSTPSVLVSPSPASSAATDGAVIIRGLRSFRLRSHLHEEFHSGKIG